VSPRQKPYFRLRTLLLLVNLFVLVVPVGSIYAFRLYENELVRQTESELIAQGAFITALYKSALLPLVADADTYGIPVSMPQARVDEKFTPIIPSLDMNTVSLFPARPDAVAAGQPDPLALKAGKAISPMLEEATLTTLAGVRLMDYRGIVVAGRDEVGLSLAGSEEVARALKGQYASLLRERVSKHTPTSYASISRGTNIRVFIAMPIIRAGCHPAFALAAQHRRGTL
jgi:hypothetical protein